MTKPKPKALKPKPKPKAAIMLPVVTGPLIAPDGPTTGSKIVITAAGLMLVEAISRQGGAQPLCASSLGITLSAFKKVVGENDGNNSCRLAYERGKAELEFEVATLLLEAGRNGHVIALIFYSKAQLGWTDAPQIGTQVGVQIVLPDSMNREEFAKRVEVRTISPPKVEEIAP
jgi:hypothetical protein